MLLLTAFIALHLEKSTKKNTIIQTTHETNNPKHCKILSFPHLAMLIFSAIVIAGILGVRQGQVYGSWELASGWVTPQNP